MKNYLESMFSKKVGLFGVPFDPTPKDEAIIIKMVYLQSKILGRLPLPDYKDPYDYFSKHLPEVLLRESLLLGEVEIPSWIRPKPEITDIDKINPDLFSEFINLGGCLKVAKKVKDFIIEKVFPRIPGMIGVDHSSTYGALLALRSREGKNLGLIVLDSHFDAVPANLRYNLYSYASESGLPIISSKYTLQGRVIPPSYPIDSNEKYIDAENFLLHIIRQEVVDINNIVVIGISDYPTSALKGNKDARVAKYVEFFEDLERRGLHFIPSSDLREYKAGKHLIENALQGLNAKKIYISLDVDIGSLSCVYASRFLNLIGLPMETIINIFRCLSTFFPHELKLSGFDIMEIDIHKLGAKIGGRYEDKTEHIVTIFLNLIGRIVKQQDI
ncbi:MAG: arginase family protein [Candidatus Bathyarchaeia archaeon]